MNDVPISTIRMLLLDDDEDIHQTAHKLASRAACPVQITCAASVTHAVDLVAAQYFDVILIDMVGPDGSLAGLELLRYLSSVHSSANVALMTHLDLDMNHTNVMNTIAISREPHITRFIDKRKSSNFVADAIDDKCQELKRSAVDFEGLEFVSELVVSRRGRYHDPECVPLRSTAQVSVEVDRIGRRLFTDRVYGERKTGVSVSFYPIERLGLSAAVLVKASVSLTIRGVRGTSSYDCILKVGPRVEIAEEAGRFLEFVKFGVRLEERVELLAHSSGDSIAAIVYSVAGGSQGEMKSLDQLFLESPETAATVIARLFGNTNWYDTHAEPESIREFFTTTYRTDFPAAFDDMRAALEKAIERAGGKLRLSTDKEIELLDRGGKKVVLPSRSFTGLGSVLRPTECCLVHGDMHGGNVMVELIGAPAATSDPASASVGRVSLIDYRQAGPGPRCIDAAALECAVRSADASAIANTEQSEADGINVALSTYSRELSALKAQWGGMRRSTHPNAKDYSEWQRLSNGIVKGAMDALRVPIPVERDEYILTCLLFGLRQLRYPMKPIARMRIAAWVGALYAVYLENNGGQR